MRAIFEKIKENQEYEENKDIFRHICNKLSATG
jgi:hypothetical protein